MVGWITRALSANRPTNRGLYITQAVFINLAPPIYAAGEYNILGRLMHYLPMHAPLNPYRVIYFFIFIGSAVESFAALGASQVAGARGPDLKVSQLKSGITFISLSVVLQGAVECIFIFMVGLLHYRCVRSKMLSKNVRNLCIMLYGTSTLILIRCIFRAIESFSMRSLPECNGVCDSIVRHEWYIYALEVVPMAIYTYWLNIYHPGKYLPRQRTRYLDFDGRTERFGPGWTEKRAYWKTLINPFNMSNSTGEDSGYEKFWLKPANWPANTDGSFAQGTATNSSGSIRTARQNQTSRV